ncbi:MAG: hypothetical protein AVDCRST_MAG77-2878, partial [uncultured Chloroflexi bacterium]
ALHSDGLGKGGRRRRGAAGGERLPRPQESPGEQEQRSQHGNDDDLRRRALGRQALSDDAQAWVSAHGHDRW